MYVSAQTNQLDPFASGLGALDNDGDDLDMGDPFAPQAGGDAVSRLISPLAMGTPLGALGHISGFSQPLNGLTGLLASLGNILQQLSQSLGGGSIGNPSSGGGGGEQYFNNAGGSSTGDPHLAFNGDGNSSRWDSMSGHNDLLDSNSIRGGYQVSTQTTTPNANGVTFNQSANVSMQNGNASVWLDNAGNAGVERDGQTYALADGQSMNLGDGERVSRGNDGTVDIYAHNARGGNIDTTLKQNGSGVDVNVNAHNVRLGGDLAHGQNGPPKMPLPAPTKREPHTLPEPFYDE